ncbi:MAG: hypothetical protein NXY57DRAFT_1033782, partial [Lentinula lateritia]
MDIDEPDTLSAATDPPPSSPGILSNVSLDIELVDLGGEEFRIRRPPGPQPAHTIALPVYNRGVFEVEYVNIYIMKCASLVQLCKTNKLGVAGKKVELQEKLVAFSENMVRWKSLIAGARRSHRGIRDSKLTAVSTKETTSILAPTKKPKKLKGSALRRITMMGLNSDGTSNSPAQRSKDMRTLAEQEALLRWADEYYAAHPYVPREDVLKELKAEGDAQVNSPALITKYMHSTQEQITGLSSIVGTVVNMLAQSMPALTSGSSPAQPLNPGLQPSLPTSTSLPPLSVVTPHPPPSLPPSAFTFAPLPTPAYLPTSAALVSAPAPAPAPMPALTSTPKPTPVPAALSTSASVFAPPFTPMPAALPTSVSVFVPPFTSTSTSTSTPTPTPAPAPLPTSASVFAHEPAPVFMPTPPSMFTSIPLPPSYKPLSNTSPTLPTNNADLSGNNVIMSDSSALPSKLRKAHKSIG